MEIDKVFNNDVDGVADNLFSAVKNSVSEVKVMQQRKAAENVQLVMQSLKKIESDIRDRFDGVGTAIENRVASIKDGRDGINGKDGRDGKDGRPGRDGPKGDRGIDGQPGRDGVDGVDGISVINAQIDFDGSLIIGLSDGKELNVGEVVSQDVAEKIKVINTMSTNAAVAVKEEGTTITNGVKSLNFVGAGVTATTSGDDVTVTVAGGGGSGTVTSVALSGGTTGLTVTGSPITTTGTITLAGTLATANGGTGQSSYAVGDLLYASTTTALSKLADVATGNALISGGVGVAPSWGKVGLTTHVSGTLPTANGGTNLTSFTSGGVVYASSTSALTTGSALSFNGNTFSVNGTSPGVGINDTTATLGVSFSFLNGGAFYSYGQIALRDTTNSQTAYAYFSGASGYHNWFQNGTEQMRLTSTGLKTKTTISVGDATPSTSGAGITFPATQSASTDANTLDDYEEGTWTPDLGGTTTYASRNGFYVKIGRLVFVSMNLQVTSIGTGSTTVISGLPFAQSGGGQSTALSVSIYSNLASNVVSIQPYVGTTAQSITMFSALAAGAANAQNAIFQNSTRVDITGCYTAA
jgi:hypothetical protein